MKRGKPPAAWVFVTARGKTEMQSRAPQLPVHISVAVIGLAVQEEEVEAAVVRSMGSHCARRSSQELMIANSIACTAEVPPLARAGQGPPQPLVSGVVGSRAAQRPSILNNGLLKLLDLNLITVQQRAAAKGLELWKLIQLSPALAK